MPLSGWLMATTTPVRVPTIVFGLFALPYPLAPDLAIYRFGSRHAYRAGDPARLADRHPHRGCDDFSVRLPRRNTCAYVAEANSLKTTSPGPAGDRCKCGSQTPEAVNAMAESRIEPGTCDCNVSPSAVRLNRPSGVEATSPSSIAAPPPPRRRAMSPCSTGATGTGCA